MCNNYNDRHGDKRQKQNWACSEEQKHLSNSNAPSPTMHLFKIKHLFFFWHMSWGSDSVLLWLLTLVPKYSHVSQLSTSVLAVIFLRHFCMNKETAGAANHCLETSQYRTGITWRDTQREIKSRLADGKLVLLNTNNVLFSPCQSWWKIISLHLSAVILNNKKNKGHIYPSIFPNWLSESQLSLGEKRGTLWTDGRSIAGLTNRGWLPLTPFMNANRQGEN